MVLHLCCTLSNNTQYVAAGVLLQDLTKDVMRIDAIPATNLDGVREWLGSMEIKYFENKVNLNW